MPRVFEAAIAVLLMTAGCVGYPTSDGQPPRSASATSYETRSPLVGTWQLLTFEVVRPSGETLPILFLGGRAGTGVIIYSADGWMSVQIAGAARPSVEADDPTRRDHPPERGAAVANSYYAYYGRYEIDPAARTVRHFIAQALHPDEAGRTYERRYEIEGDVLTLSAPPVQVEGEQRFARLRWRRVAAAAGGSIVN